MSAAQLKHVNGIGGKRGAGSGTTLLVPAGASAKPYLPDLPAPTVTVAKGPKKSTHAARKAGTKVKAASKSGRHTAPAKKTTAAKGAKKR